MLKHHEMLSLIGEYSANESNLTIEQIAERAYGYYDAGELEPTSYDYIMGLIDDLG